MRAASGPRSTISLLRTDKLALISVPEILKINERYLVNGEKLVWNIYEWKVRES